MTLALAEKLTNEVIAKAKEMGVKAVVCVSDKGGHPILVKCMDDAYMQPAGRQGHRR